MYAEKILTFLKKLNIKCLVFLYILMMTIMPIVSRATSTYLTTYTYMIVVTVSVLFSFIACQLSHIREYMIFLLPFVIYEGMVSVFMNNEDALLAGYQALLFLLPVCLGYYLVTHIFFVEMHSVALIIIVSITCITTIIGCMRYPDASRVLATTDSSQDAFAVLYDWHNIGGYGFVYSSVLLYPFVILAFKMKRLHFVFVIAFTALLLYMVIQASYTYAMLLMLLSMLMFFVRRDIPLKKFLLLMLGFVVVVLIFRVAIAAILSYIGELIDNPSMVEKINAAFLGTDAVDNFDDDRGALYMQSFEMFLKSPFIGSLAGGRKVTGGHSFILDNLALYGLVGGGLMALMYRCIFLTFIRPLKDKPGYTFVFWIFLQTIILSVINTGMWLQNLCVYTPIFICAIYGKEVYIDVVKPKPMPEIPVKVLK